MDIDRVYLKIIEKTGLSITEIQNLIKLKKEELILQKEKKFKTYKILKRIVSDQEALINVAKDLGVKIQSMQEGIQIRFDATYDEDEDEEEEEYDEEYDEETLYWENIDSYMISDPETAFWEEKQRIEDVKAMEEMDEEHIYENLIEQQVMEEEYYREIYQEVTNLDISNIFKKINTCENSVTNEELAELFDEINKEKDENRKKKRS